MWLTCALDRPEFRGPHSSHVSLLAGSVFARVAAGLCIPGQQCWVLGRAILLRCCCCSWTGHLTLLCVPTMGCRVTCQLRPMHHLRFRASLDAGCLQYWILPVFRVGGTLVLDSPCTGKSPTQRIDFDLTLLVLSLACAHFRQPGHAHCICALVSCNPC